MWRPQKVEWGGQEKESWNSTEKGLVLKGFPLGLFTPPPTSFRSQCAWIAVSGQNERLWYYIG